MRVVVAEQCNCTSAPYIDGTKPLYTNNERIAAEAWLTWSRPVEQGGLLYFGVHLCGRHVLKVHP